jgi:hypothetical protein
MCNHFKMCSGWQNEPRMILASTCLLKETAQKQVCKNVRPESKPCSEHSLASAGNQPFTQNGCSCPRGWKCSLAAMGAPGATFALGVLPMLTFLNSPFGCGHLGLGQRCTGYLTPRVVNLLLQLVQVHQRLVVCTLLPAWLCTDSQALRRQQEPLTKARGAR